VPPGEASLSVEVPGRPARLDGPFPLADGAAVRRVVEIPAETGLSLRLFDQKGVPLANPKAAWLDGSSGAAVDHATGGDDGRLVFTGNHPAGAYLVSAYALRDGVSFCANREIRFDPRHALHLDLQVVEGCVLRGKMAAPGPQSFRIDVKGSGTDPLRYYLGEGVNGHFELRGLDPGRYAVRVRSERGRVVPTSCTLAPGATVDVELQAPSRK
jgi:hypothetical protein